jgi:hypothetical protein
MTSENAWKVAALALAAAVMGGSGAEAAMFQQCLTPQGQVNPQQTQTFMQLMRANDMQGAQAISGVWYTEIPAPQLNMVSYQYQSFQPTGNWEYRDKTCTAGTNFCSENQGHGQFAAVRQNDGSLYVMVNFSDMQRNSTCIGYFARVQGSTFQTSEGQQFQRVQ